MPETLSWNDATLRIAAVVYMNAERKFDSIDVKSEAVITSLQKAEGLRVSIDQAPLLRLAAIIPIIAANLTGTEKLTPTEFHHHYSKAFRREVNVTREELSELKNTIKGLDLNNTNELIEYVNIGYALRLGELFGLIQTDMDLRHFDENTAKAVTAEELLFNPHGPDLEVTTSSSFTGKPTATSTITATAATLVYTSAFRLYEKFQHTMPKKVIPNAKRAEDQAAAKRARQESKSVERQGAKRRKQKLKGGRAAVETSQEESDEEEAGQSEDSDGSDVE